jgi:hypothetical protein
MAMAFLSFLNLYSYQEEMVILGLENATRENKESFQKYFSSLLVLLWTKALRSGFPDNHKEIYEAFLEKYSAVLAAEAGRRGMGFDYRYLAEFLELSKKKDGLVFIASFFASMVKRNKQEQLAVTKRILKRILQHLKAFVEATHSANLEKAKSASETRPRAEPLASTVNNLVNKVFFSGPEPKETSNFMPGDASQVIVGAVKLGLDVLDPKSVGAKGSLAKGASGGKGNDAQASGDYDELEETQRDVQAPRAKNPTKPPSEAVRGQLGELPSIEETEMENVFVFIPDEEPERRIHPRLLSVNARILLEDSVRELPVVDVSQGGVAILHEGWRFKDNDVLSFDLIHRYKVILTGVKARIVRNGEETIGCEFVGLTPEQDRTLRRYILALEKKSASLAAASA